MLRCVRFGAATAAVRSRSQAVTCWGAESSGPRRAQGWGGTKQIPDSSSSRPAHQAVSPGSRAAPRGAVAVAAADGAAQSAKFWTVELRTHATIPAGGADVADMGLELVVIGSNATQEPANGTFRLNDAAAIVAFERRRPELPGRVDRFTISLPDGFTPVAVTIANEPNKGGSLFQGNNARVYLKMLSLTPGRNADPSTDSVRFTANSYLVGVQGPRLFVRNDAWSSTQWHNAVAQLQANELLQMQGAHDSNPRKPGDRIYAFAPYNDLGKAGAERPVLGTMGLKYPRRLATNRAADGIYESEPNTSGILQPLLGDADGILGATVDALAGAVLKAPWVPEDDNFSAVKGAGFVGTAVASALPQLVDAVGMMFGTGVGKDFDSFAEVLSLYDFMRAGGTAPPAPAQGSAAKRAVDALRAIVSPLSLISGMHRTTSTPGITNLLRFEAPRSLTCNHPAGAAAPRCDKLRYRTWDSDEEYGRQFLAGMNPFVLEAVVSMNKLDELLPEQDRADGSALVRKSLIRNAKLTGVLEGNTLQSLASSAQNGDEPRLFVVDYSLLYDLDLPATPASLGASDDNIERHLHGGRCLLFRRKDGHLVPVAIELAEVAQLTGLAGKPERKGHAPILYTASDGKAIWLLAKCIFGSIDSGYHQLVSHFVQTHASMEPFLISLRRKLSPTHPIFRLLMPHFRYTLAINAAARSQLINAGGVIEKCFTPGWMSMALSAKVYEKKWRFDRQGLVADLEARGFMAGNKLRVKDYPYAEDGLLIWGALEDYFTSYTNRYYADDAAVAADTALKDWWNDVKTNGHPDKQNEFFIDPTTKKGLVDICTTVAWVASAHHAAVNFGQYAYAAWPVTHSSLVRRAAPKKNSDEWKALAGGQLMSEHEQEILSYLAPPKTAATIMVVTKLLSSHATDEQYLSAGEDMQEWLPLVEDPRLAAIFAAFHARMLAVDAQVDARNLAGRVARTPAPDGTGGLPYTLLRPSPRVSGSAGETFDGVPYSVSI